MTSQWAAVGAETDPLRRARELQRSWEQLLAEGALGPELSPRTIAGLRPTIVESWRRSLATGLDPTDLLAPIEANGAENGPLLVQEALGNAEQAMAGVRELAHGILPSVLTQGGLRAGIDALGSRTPVPVEIDVSVDRLPAPVEASAYFVVAEALTNVAKHSSAGHAEVVAQIDDGTLRVEVHDDGVGGASPDGTGLVGLADRLAVLDGRLEVDSPPGGGTRLTAAIPLQEVRNHEV